MPAHVLALFYLYSGLLATGQLIWVYRNQGVFGNICCNCLEFIRLLKSGGE